MISRKSRILTDFEFIHSVPPLCMDFSIILWPTAIWNYYMENLVINNSCLELQAIRSSIMKSSALLLSRPEHESFLCPGDHSALCVCGGEQGTVKGWCYRHFRHSLEGLEHVPLRQGRWLCLLVILCILYLAWDRAVLIKPWLRQTCSNVTTIRTREGLPSWFLFCRLSFWFYH